jgi:hypothetical protein
MTCDLIFMTKGTLLFEQPSYVIVYFLLSCIDGVPTRTLFPYPKRYAERLNYYFGF